MYCRNCGVEVSDNTTICPHCGCPQAPLSLDTSQAPYEMADSGHIGWAILGFFIPIAGLILFLLWFDTKPKTAKAAGKGALVSLIADILAFGIGVMAFLSAVGRF